MSAATECVMPTCHDLPLSAGPSDALLTAGSLTAGQNFDDGNVCANSDKAFVYIKNDCILPSRAVINVRAQCLADFLAAIATRYQQNT